MQDELWRKCWRISQNEKGPLGSPERGGWTMLKMMWRKWVLEAGKYSKGYRRLEIDPEGGQDQAWTEEPVEKSEDYFIANFHS